jgi:hypothetical protein
MLQLDYVAADELTRQADSWWRTVLGVVGFERPPSVNGARGQDLLLEIEATGGSRS